jgi:hypothetical protein
VLQYLLNINYSNQTPPKPRSACRSRRRGACGATPMYGSPIGRHRGVHGADQRFKSCESNLEQHSKGATREASPSLAGDERSEHLWVLARAHGIVAAGGRGLREQAGELAGGEEQESQKNIVYRRGRRRVRRNRGSSLRLI